MYSQKFIEQFMKTKNIVFRNNLSGFLKKIMKNNSSDPYNNIHNSIAYKKYLYNFFCIYIKMVNN